MNYGPALAAAFVLWPLLAIPGGQAFAPLMGLTAIAALALSRPKMPPARFALAGFAFVVWAALSALWGPSVRQLATGSLVEGTYSFEAQSLALPVLAVVSALTLAGTLRAAPAPRALTVVLTMLAVQAATVIASPYALDALLPAVYGPEAHRQAEGAQNAARNANTLALALPLLVSLLVFRWGIKGIGLTLLLTAGALSAYVQLDAQTAMFAFCGMAAAMGFVAALPRTGYRWLLGGLAAYILAAPLVFWGFIRALDPVAQSLPGSFRSRLWSWETVIGRIGEAPLMGHGLDATSTWKDTFATRPEWLAQLPDFWKDYPVVPGHPHNMALQIWAETGFIGAALASLSLAALAFHLPRPGDLRPEIRFAAAGLAGAAAAIFSFAYAMWNQGFWASLALAAAAIILWHRTPKASPA